MTRGERSYGLAAAVASGLGADWLGAPPVACAIAGVFGFFVVYVVYLWLTR
jgi:hypothetical protein